jgi:spermidine/putrescine transport system permease protein
MVILKAQGALNALLLWMGVIHQPLQILYSNIAVFIGLTYDYLPFMILPLYANIEKLDDTLIEAARDLGAKTPRIFLKIIFPLTMPGIMAGVMLVFLPSITMFYIPDLLGGAKSLLLGNLIENQFLLISNWPIGSATSIGLIILLCLMLVLHRRATKGQDQQELL